MSPRNWKPLLGLRRDSVSVETGYDRLVNKETAADNGRASLEEFSPLTSTTCCSRSDFDDMRKRSSSSHHRAASSLRWLVPLILVLCGALGLLLGAIASAIVTRRASGASAALLKSPVPEMPLEVRYFEFNDIYISPSSPETDEAWNHLLPNGRGYVFVPEASQYGLPPGIETPHGEIYSIALYHQMHCLGLLRRNYWRLSHGILGENGERSLSRQQLEEEARHQKQNSHTGHCFDYIRQSIECSADMTLEWPRVEPDGTRFQVDGRAVPHVCTSKYHLHDYMARRSYNGSRNHDIAA